MAVYTKINDKDIQFLTKKFNLNKIIKFQGIKKGIENTNYLLNTNSKKYILTIFEKRVKKEDLPFFMKLMDKLNQQKINCPKPLKDNKGKYLTLIKNKSACIVTFVKGKDKNHLNNKNCYEVGKNIGKLHKASKNIKLFRKNSMSINNLDSLLKNIKFKSKSLAPNLRSVLEINLDISWTIIFISPVSFMEIYLLIIFFLIKISLLDLLIFTFHVTIIQYMKSQYV